MKKLLTLAVVLSALLLAPMPAPAMTCTTTISAGDDIQAAIDSATPGDVICLAPGTYTPAATIQVNKAITLASADPSTKPLIDGDGTLGTIIYIAADDVTLDGLEITNGTADLVKSDSPAVSRVTVRNCTMHGSSGDEGVQLKHCTDCLIECCLAYDVRQDGFNMAYSSGGTIRNCEVYNSRSENAAIYVYDSYDMTVACNYIHDTQAANGIGFYYNYGGTHTIANNLIVHNTWWGGKHCYDEADGNGIWIYKPRVASTYLVSHNTLDDNTPVNPCAQPGNAIYVKKSAGSVIVNVDDSIVTNHNGYGIRTWSGAVVNYSYNDLWQNALGATDGNPVDGGGNISEDPVYNSDYTLGAGSPCISAASDGSDMGRLFDECGCEPPVIEVTIDIKPGSDPNSINPDSKGKIPVAVLSSPDFDAPNEVDWDSLTFGRTGEEDSLAFCSPSPEDVNCDGYDDLVCHFYTQRAGFACGDEWGYLKGETLDNVPIEGSDSVRIVPCK